MNKKALIVLAAVALPTLAYAADAPIPGLELIGVLVQYLSSLPGVGPILGKLFEIVALVGAVMTYLSVAAIGLLKLPELAARFAGLQGMADKLQAISDKVLPWLKWLSLFNVQKKQ